MKPKEVFALCVRVIGLLGLIVVLNHVVNDLIDGPMPSLAFLAKKVIYICAGIYLLRGAPHLVNAAFGAEPPTSTPKPGP